MVGGQGIEWNAKPNQYVYDFGYPQGPPFDGQSLQEYDGFEFASPYVSGTSGLPSSFTGGSSGGPWLAEFNGTGGYVTGVDSFVITTVPGYMFSPYFSSNAGALYNLVANL